MSTVYLKQPDQQVYDEIFKRLSNIGIAVFDVLPGLDTAYPFVVLNDSQLLPTPTKSFLIGKVSLTIHVWEEFGNRRGITDLIGRIRSELSQIKDIDGRTFYFDRQSSSQVLVDNSTDEPLLHAVMDIEFKFI